MFKTCKQCEQEKPVGDFYRDKSVRDGRRAHCKVCVDNRRRTLWGWKKREPTPEGMRRCSECRDVQPLESFNPSTGSGKGYVCAACKPRYTRNVWYRTTYGVTLTYFEELKERQGNRCAACRDDLESGQLDHDHATGEVRGVLCAHCNRALGMLRDDPLRIQNLFNYLVGE